MKYLVLIVLVAVLGAMCGCTWVDYQMDQQARVGETTKVQYYLDKGADVNAKNVGGSTALITASAYGHLEPAKLLIDRGADLNFIDKRGQTALMHAGVSGSPELIKLLIDRGADVNVIDKHGCTAWMYAASIGNLELIKLFIDGGADVNIPSGTSILIINQYLIDREIDGIPREMPLRTLWGDRRLRNNWATPCANYFTLSPGIHNIKISLYEPVQKELYAYMQHGTSWYKGEPISFDINTKSGYFYSIKYEKFGEERWTTWIEEMKYP
jgi:hypothetical protein